MRSRNTLLGLFSISLALIVFIVINPSSGKALPNVIITKAQTRLVDQTYRLDAVTALSLSHAALEALENGIELTLVANITVSHPRTLWFSKVTKDASQKYHLRFHDLSQRYIVIDSQSGLKTQFRTHTSALIHIGEIQNFPLITVDDLEVDLNYFCQLSYSLDISELPAPLRLKAYFFNDWHFNSETYQWRLQ